MSIQEIYKDINSHAKRKRVGRGNGSGTGKTCGVGQKGQKSRSGVSIKQFEGGQMPIHKRLPKRGFNNPNKKISTIIKLEKFDNLITKKIFKSTDVINKSLLIKLGLIKNELTKFRILASQKFSLKLTFQISENYFSKSARGLIEKNGGKLLINNNGE